MSFDFETKISAKLINEKTVIINPKMQNILTERGFGESEKDSLILNSFETLYLLYNDKLELKKINKSIVFDELMQKYIQKEDDILNKRQSDLVDPTSLCNVQELCITSENKTKDALNSEINKPCNEVTKSKSELKQKLLENMINEFDVKYNKSKRDHEEELIEKIGEGNDDKTV